MTGQNVTINDLTQATVLALTYSVPVMAAGATNTERATVEQFQNTIGIYVGTGAPTSTSVTHPSLYLRTDGTATNNRAYISTSTGGWVAFVTVS